MRIAVLDALYPPACLLCRRRVVAPLSKPHAGLGARNRLFCDACEGAMPVLRPPVCQRCGVGLDGAYDAQFWCSRCRTRAFAFEQARAPFVYLGAVREAIHAFKYDGHRRIGSWLAERMAQTAARDLPVEEVTAVLPVPMHWLKRRLKGANPAAFLAQTVAELLHRPCHLRAVQRRRWTPSQTRLSLRQRFRNVADAFRPCRRAVEGQTILLVDDVLTSGATAHACADALRTAGAARVYVLTAACAPRP